MTIFLKFWRGLWPPRPPLATHIVHNTFRTRLWHKSCCHFLPCTEQGSSCVWSHVEWSKKNEYFGFSWENTARFCEFNYKCFCIDIFTCNSYGLLFSFDAKCYAKSWLNWYEKRLQKQWQFNRGSSLLVCFSYGSFIRRYWSFFDNGWQYVKLQKDARAFSVFGTYVYSRPTTARINCFDCCNGSFFAGMNLTLNKSQVHSCTVMQWWACCSLMYPPLSAEVACGSRERILLLDLTITWCNNNMV